MCPIQASFAWVGLLIFNRGFLVSTKFPALTQRWLERGTHCFTFPPRLSPLIGVFQMQFFQSVILRRCESLRLRQQSIGGARVVAL